MPTTELTRPPLAPQATIGQVRRAPDSKLHVLTYSWQPVTSHIALKLPLSLSLDTPLQHIMVGHYAAPWNPDDPKQDEKVVTLCSLEFKYDGIRPPCQQHDGIRIAPWMIHSPTAVLVVSDEHA